MKLVRPWEEEGITIPEPYKRTIKTIFSPDEEKGGIKELLFTQAIIHPHSQTDYHTHDRPELIYVVYGRGVSVCEGEEIEIQSDMALWVPAGEKHQIKNTGDETMKLATVFVPGFSWKENVKRCQEAAQKRGS
ncbi:MAG: cupin domain-containing protein [Deltaproteobacteria bacterium]|nr:cupin domain-containing protein [Deltaproteobacteria bacterium]MBW2122777.1 cupin domain-containing protein [Deltaproteobacteria bacterium]